MSYPFSITRAMLILVIIPVYLNVDAQQWKPVSNTDKFNFRIDTAVYISNIIAVDSFALQGGDTVFCLNRIVTDIPGIYYEKLYNQPQFLERKMTQRPGGVCLFSDPHSFRINTWAGLSATWIFDSSANITAQVTSKAFELVMTQWDSVKTITLSNSEIIRISKDHGIIQFPLSGTNHSYLLEGIDGRNLGVHVPGFRETFNFHVGDVFQYRDLYAQYGSDDGWVSLVKQTIFSRDSSSAGYSYGFKESIMRWNRDPFMGYEWDTTHYFFPDTSEVFIDSATHFANVNPQGMVRNPTNYFIPPFTSAAIMFIYPDTGTTVSRQMGEELDGYSLFSFGVGDTLISGLSYLYIDKYTVGLGRTINKVGIFENYNEEILIGYVKNGNTTGIVYPDDFLLEKVPETDAGKFNIFPNPVTDKLIVELTALPGNTNLSLMNVEGQELMHKQITNQKTLVDFGPFPAGVYFLRIKNEKTVQTRKVIKE
jgi:hypothetical protein